MLTFKINSYTGIPVIALVRTLGAFRQEHSIIQKAVFVSRYIRHSDRLEFIDDFGTSSVVEANSYDRNDKKYNLKIIALPTPSNISYYKECSPIDREILQERSRINSLREEIKKDISKAGELFKEGKKIVVFLKNEMHVFPEKHSNNKESHVCPTPHQVVSDSNNSRSKWFFEVSDNTTTQRINISKDARQFYIGTIDEFKTLLGDIKKAEDNIKNLMAKRQLIEDKISWRTVDDEKIKSIFPEHRCYAKFKYTKRGQERQVQGDKKTADAIRILSAQDTDNPKDISYIRLSKLHSLLPKHNERQVKMLTSSCDIIEDETMYVMQSSQELDFLIPIEQLSLILKDNETFKCVMGSRKCSRDIDEAEIKALKRKYLYQSLEIENKKNKITIANTQISEITDNMAQTQAMLEALGLTTQQILQIR